MNYISKDQVINILKKLEIDTFGNNEAQDVLDAAIMQIFKIKSLEGMQLATSILIDEREKYRLTDEMIFNAVVSMEDSKKYRISCEVKTE